MSLALLPEAGDAGGVPATTPVSPVTPAATPASPVTTSATLATPAAAAIKPVTFARERLVEVVAPLEPLVPDGGLRRGSTVVVSGRSPAGGATTLVVALLAGSSAAGGWCAVVGAPWLGAATAAQFGVRLERLALVPHPGERWPVAAAALLDSMDMVVLAPPGRPRPRDAERLVARARERGAVLVVPDVGGGESWPGRGDLRLDVEAGAWVGPGDGDGYLRARRAEVVASGRGAAARARRVSVWLPGPDGAVAVTAGDPQRADWPLVSGGPMVAAAGPNAST